MFFYVFYSKTNVFIIYGFKEGGKWVGIDG